MTWDQLEVGEFRIVSTTPADADHDLVTVEVSYGGDQCYLRARAD